MRTSAGFLFLCASLTLAQSPDKVTDAINEVARWEQVGQQPYEMTWTARAEHPATLVDFENLAGWKLECYAGAKGEFRRSREQQMWGAYTGKFVVSGSGAQSRVVARPPKPIPIPGAFDSVEMWGYGNRWGWESDKTTPALGIAVLVVDARGKEHSIALADVNWKQWWLIHRKLPAKTAQDLVQPASISGIEISKISNAEPRYFFCDSLALFKEELKPLTFQPQPKRNLKPYHGQIVGLNTGEGTLPFPTREETILPTNFEKDFKTTVSVIGRDRFELRYTGRDAALRYVYSPAKGTLDEIAATADGAPALTPLAGGGVRFTDTAENAVAKGELVDAQVNDGAVVARFRFGARMVEYQLRIWQKSLIVDAWCEGGEAVELKFGRVAGLTNAKRITIPYITFGRRQNPGVAMSAGARPLFASVWFDWYRSNGSEPYSPKEPQATTAGVDGSGGVRYLARTDGARNPLYERLFVTVSPVYEETLPTIANPPSLRQREGREVLWTVTAPDSWEKDHAQSKRISTYGLDHVMQHSHEVTWRDEGDSNTMKLMAAPQKGGDAKLQWYVSAQNALGWLQGAYTNYTDFCTVNTNWNPDHVLRVSDGEWHRAWARNYALKPAKAVEFDEYYAQRIKAKFGTKMSYTDVHSAVGPWQYCDYDARVPGAGTMAATFYAYGQLLLNDQRVYGPTQSEATYQWLYAGLESGSYGWVYTDVNLLTHPLDVAFKLMKLVPLEAGYGMGYTFYYLEQIDKEWTKSPRRREYVDLFLATSIAYGNMGWLVREFGEDEFGIETLARSYYMMQQAQQQYAFQRPKTIEYAGADGRMMTASAAHATGAIAEGRLHVVYENATEVYVNRNPTKTWMVKDENGADVELPVSGWLVFNRAAKFRELSALVGGRRIDYALAPEYEFLDGRGTWTEHGSLASSGSVVLRRRGEDVMEMIDLYGNRRVAFQAVRDGVLTAYDADGRSLGTVEAVSTKPGWREFKPVEKGRKYVYAPSGGR
jgi:hypothetical protein